MNRTAPTPIPSMSKWNYVEFVFHNHNGNSVPVNIDLGEFAFFQLLANFPKPSMFSKNITRYFHGDLIYEVCNKEIKTFKKTPIDYVAEKANVKLFYYKEKIPFYLFPSTQDIHEVQNISSAIFRIHNNIYMNFDIITYPNQKGCAPTYKVYLNYNHEPNIDADHVKKILMDLQTQISSTGLHFPNFLL